MADTGKARNKGKQMAIASGTDNAVDKRKRISETEGAPISGTDGSPSKKKAKRDTTGEKAGGKGKLTLQQRYEIVKQLKSGRTKAALAKEYNVSGSAVAKIERASDAITKAMESGMEPANTRRMRYLDKKMAALDKSIVDYVALCRRAFFKTKLRATYRMICEKARKVARALGMTTQVEEVGEDGAVVTKEADWAPNTGWFDRMSKRLGLKETLHMEPASIDMAAAAPLMDEFRKSLEPWDVDCIFVMDETGLFYGQLPSYKSVVKDESEVKGKAARGSQANKLRDRVTLVVSANATGTCKVPITVIGKVERPDVFRVLAPPPVPYLSQANVWVDEHVCQQWFDTVFVPAVRKFTTEPVVLLWSNCPGHAVKNNDPQITIKTIPPLLTTVFQPCDHGILAALKAGYKLELVTRVAAVIANWDGVRRLGANTPRGCKGLSDGHPPHALELADMVRTQWDKVTPQTIVDCFIRAGCLPAAYTESLKGMSHRWRRNRAAPAVVVPEARGVVTPVTIVSVTVPVPDASTPDAPQGDPATLSATAPAGGGQGPESSGREDDTSTGIGSEVPDAQPVAQGIAREEVREAEEKDVVEETVASVVTIVSKMSLPPAARDVSRLPEILLDNLCFRTDESGLVRESLPVERLTAAVRAWMALEDDPEQRMAILNEAVEELELRRFMAV